MIESMWFRDMSAESIDIVSYFKALPDSMKTEEICEQCLRLNWYVIPHIPHSIQARKMQVIALKACVDAAFYIEEDDLDDAIREAGF
jgi:hypothetical protein